MANSKRMTTLLSATALAAGALFSGSAFGADILIDPPVVEAPEIPVERSGWYLRGDITYDYRESNGGTFYDVGTKAVNGGGMYSGVDSENSFDVGFGIGYQINDYFRVDATGEYVFAAGWKGTAFMDDTTAADGLGACPLIPTTGGGVVGNFSGSCTSTDSADVSMFRVMGNAYWDIAHFSGFTPYIGAGLGGAYVMYDDYKGTEVATTGAGCVGCDPTATRTSTHKGLSSWRFAYALHAGFAYDLGYDWKVDFGYSYTDIAGGAMAAREGGGKAFAYDDGFTDHVFRAGLRYQIW